VAGADADLPVAALAGDGEAIPYARLVQAAVMQPAQPLVEAGELLQVVGVELLAVEEDRPLHRVRVIEQGHGPLPPLPSSSTPIHATPSCVVRAKVRSAASSAS